MAEKYLDAYETLNKELQQCLGDVEENINFYVRDKPSHYDYTWKKLSQDDYMMCRKQLIELHGSITENSIILRKTLLPQIELDYHTMEANYTFIFINQVERGIDDCYARLIQIWTDLTMLIPEDPKLRVKFEQARTKTAAELKKLRLDVKQ